VSDVLDSFDSSSFIFSFAGVLVDSRLKSRADPGVFGVFEAPKDANAPVPKPNALDALVGEARDVELKGFLLLCEELSPALRPSV
jgi:hypothetical protein